MKYPKEVQEFVDVLEKYTESEKLKRFNVIHMYPKGLAYPNGFYDSQLFEMVIYNTETDECRHLGQHDGVKFEQGCDMWLARVFADGAFLLRSRGFMALALNVLTQEISVKKADAL